MKKSLLKDSIREIKNTYKRFLSIVLIVLLGVGFFAGMQAASPDMKDTVDTYFNEQNMMDIEVISTLGLTENDIKALEQLEGIKEVDPAYSFDANVKAEEKNIVVKIGSMPENINKLNLLEGTLPENSDECVVESSFLSGTGYSIDDYLTIEPEKMDSSILNSNEDLNEDSEESVVKNTKIKIVGTVKSPEYISRSRGTSKLGAGTINYYMYIPKTNINMSVYTMAYITANGALELETYSNAYDDLISEVKDKIDVISAERKQIRYDEIVNDANSKLNDAQAEYDEQKKKAEDEIANAEKQINDAKNEVADGEEQLAYNQKNAEAEFSKAEKLLQEEETKLKKGKETYYNEKTNAEAKIKEAETNLNSLKTTKVQYDTFLEQKNQIEKQIANIEETLKILNKDPVENKEQIQELTIKKEELNKNLVQINYAISGIEDALSKQGLQASKLEETITNISNEINFAKQELIDAENKLLAGEEEIEKSKQELTNSRKEANRKFAVAKQEIEDGKAEIAENETKLQDAKKEAEEKLADAQEKLNDARTQISKIEKPTWYILDRNSNYGYAEYIQDADRIANIARVFPAVFFVVAALISLTSMSRMIEEQRVQIGTLKALGYNKLEISMKYIIYALLATLIGGLVGMCIGFRLLPDLVASMYEMMYTLPKPEFPFRINIGIVGLIFALISTVGATICTCIKELKENPASLMLPRAPKPGKRIILERIKPIWSRLKFTQKVTARNIFRYKKKFLMTIIGVAGCTALIVAGFGIRDSVSQMIPTQYGEIFKYDGVVTLNDDLPVSRIKEETENIKQEENVEDTIACYMKTVEITNIENSQTINLVAVDSEDNLSNFIEIRSRKKEQYKLDDEKVIISDKIARLLKIKVGDKITIKNTDDIEKDVIVGAITENYIYHYIYMSEGLYNSLYGENSYKPNTILIKEKEGISLDEEEKLGSKLLQDTETIAGVTFLSNTKDIFSEVMEKMELVVYILIVAAALLAFAVLYNLSNVNISERIRELATLKVLGFYNKEVFNYITKETRILTAIGILFGLIGGYFLSMYIIKTCELDMFMFIQKVKAMSFIYGFIITIIFAEIVNIAVKYTLKKISMTESLKSVD